jgi:hypothetical protein
VFPTGPFTSREYLGFVPAHPQTSPHQTLRSPSLPHATLASRMIREGSLVSRTGGGGADWRRQRGSDLGTPPTNTWSGDNNSFSPVSSRSRSRVSSLLPPRVLGCCRRPSLILPVVLWRGMHEREKELLRTGAIALTAPAAAPPLLPSQLGDRSKHITTTPCAAAVSTRQLCRLDTPPPPHPASEQPAWLHSKIESAT